MNEEYLSAIEGLAEASTAGPLELGVCIKDIEPVEWFEKCLALSNLSDVWVVSSAQGSIVAITGNGPTSESNARFIADARDLCLALIQKVRVLQERLARSAEELRQANACIDELLPDLLPEKD